MPVQTRYQTRAATQDTPAQVTGGESFAFTETPSSPLSSEVEDYEETSRLALEQSALPDDPGLIAERAEGNEDGFHGSWLGGALGDSSSTSEGHDDMYVDARDGEGVNKNSFDILKTAKHTEWRAHMATLRRSQSHDTFRSRTPLSKDQERAVHIAQSKLTRPQRDLIDRRNERLSASAHRERSQSPVGGPSYAQKGKGPDPRNWGGVNIPEEELDVGAQRAAYESLQRQKNAVVDNGGRSGGHGAHENAQNGKSTNKGDKNKPSKAARRHRSATAPISQEVEGLIDGVVHGTKGHAKEGKSRKASNKDGHAKAKKSVYASFKPIHQVNPKSYLGKVLDGGSPSSDSSSSDSDSSSDDSSSDSESSSSDSEDSSSSNSSSESSDSSDSDSSDSSSDDDEYGRKRRHKKSKSKRKAKRSKRSKRSLLKPIPPHTYDGSPDPQEFHQFASTGLIYLKDGRVKKDREVLVLSMYLSGKALTFYTREVSLQNKRWDANKFLKELFNHCFPVDFRSRQRKKLRRCFQNDKTVKEYAAEINELFVTIGFADKRERVHKFWTGLRPEIQKALWRDKLNPEISSFKQVLRSAEINEIAENVEVHDRDRDRKRPKDNAPKERNNGNQQSNGNSKNRRHNSFGKRTNSSPGFSSVKNESRKWEDRRQAKPPKRRNELSDKEKDQLRAENRCFNCKQVGHTG